MLEVISRNRILHDVEVGRALEEVLALPAGVFCADLLAVYALDGQTLVLLFCAKLDERGMDIIQRRSRKIGCTLPGLGHLWGALSAPGDGRAGSRGR